MVPLNSPQQFGDGVLATTHGWRFEGGAVDETGAPIGPETRFAVADSALLRVYLGLTIGRNPALNAFAIADDAVSRRHARLTRTADGLAIEDLHSLNGVWVNGERLPIFQPRPIGDGDDLALGRVRLTVRRI